MQIQDRDYEILLWILHMKFAALNDITRVFFKNCNPNRAPYRRILKLNKEGLLEKRRIYRDSHDYYVATWKTVRFLRSRHFQYVPDLVKKERFFQQFEHDQKLIELRIFAKELGLGLWIPERVIRSIKPRGACPDAVLYNFDARYAVEYEWSEKDRKRYEESFERYETKEKYAGALYILPTERRLEKLRRKMLSSPKKIYFISEERLLREREKAFFESSWKSMPLKHLLQYSFKDRSLEDLERNDLKELVQSEGPDGWKERKPFIPWGGGGGRGESEEDAEEPFGTNEDDFSGPSMYPPMYLDEERPDKYEEEIF